MKKKSSGISHLLSTDGKIKNSKVKLSSRYFCSVFEEQKKQRRNPTPGLAVDGK